MYNGGFWIDFNSVPFSQFFRVGGHESSVCSFLHGDIFYCVKLTAAIIWIKFIFHDDVTKWKHFPRNWPFVWGIHRSPVNSSHKGQWRGALMFSLICAWINDWVNSREAGDLIHYRAHYDVIVMFDRSMSLPQLSCGDICQIWTWFSACCDDVLWDANVFIFMTILAALIFVISTTSGASDNENFNKMIIFSFQYVCVSCV